MPISKSSRTSRSKKSKKGSIPSRSKPARTQVPGKSVLRHLPQQPSQPRVPPERRLDLAGAALILTGMFAMASLVKPSASSMTSGQIHFLRQLFGWGAYLFPIMLLVIGGWLLLRNVKGIPSISIGRIFGMVLSYSWLLTAMNVFAGKSAKVEGFTDIGKWGGYIGSQLLRALWTGLGSAGAIIALLAWLLIALTMTFDLSIYELYLRLNPLIVRLRQNWVKRRADRLRGDAKVSGDIESSLANGFTPMQPLPESLEQIIPAGYTRPQTSTSAAVITWILPQIKEILDTGSAPSVNREFIEQRGRLIEATLASFSAPVQVIEINRGPSVTQFGVEPLFIETRNGRTRVRVSKIVSLADDLALALAAPRIRIQAPVPGRRFVGIEVPNDEMTLVALRDIVESDIFQRGRPPLRFALGRDVSGHPLVADLTSMPHLLIAGATGSGKSVCVNSILTSFLLHNAPSDLRLLLVDPKRVELTNYNGIPHLLAPVVVEMERVIGALQWLTREMDKRYHQFAQAGARNITDYNARMKLQGNKKLPYLVVVIDELADLMLIAPDETERMITRLAQLARATGIHIVLATQRPSVDVVTGLIKANFPARIAFAVVSGVDSRVILDQPGAERLLGRGDMLYQAADAPAPVRLQGVFVSDPEIQKLVTFWRQQASQLSAYAIPGAPVDAPPAGVPLKQAPLWEDLAQVKLEDPLLSEAIDLVRREGRVSVSMLQRKLRIGYTRAARLVDTMEEEGIVSQPEGNTQHRSVLDYGPAAPPKEE